MFFAFFFSVLFVDDFTVYNGKHSAEGLSSVPKRRVLLTEKVRTADTLPSGTS